MQVSYINKHYILPIPALQEIYVVYFIQTLSVFDHSLFFPHLFILTTLIHVSVPLHHCLPISFPPLLALCTFSGITAQ